MEQPRQLTEDLIRRLQRNECTPGELALIRQWIASMELNEAESGITPELLAELKMQMHQQLMQHIQAAPVVNMQRRKSVRRIAAAAALLLMVVPGVVLWYMTRKSSTVETVRALTVIENNKKNVIQKITLPDGTLVWLNRQARLEFDPQQFNRAQRFVKLSGEGFFEVMPDKARPFIVQTGELQTRVLGTAFNIEAWDNAAEIRVSLVHGKVALDNTVTAQTTLLSPSHTFYYSKSNRTGMILPMVVADIQQWTKGQLVFNEVPLEEAIQRIQEEYELSIQYDAKLVRNKRITAAIPAGNWQSALQNILFVHGLSYRQAQHRIIIVRN